MTQIGMKIVVLCMGIPFTPNVNLIDHVVKIKIYVKSLNRQATMKSISLNRLLIQSSSLDNKQRFR